MKRPSVALVGACLLLSSPALGQGLSERVDHMARRRAQAQVACPTRKDMLRILTRTTVTVQFNETPARDALRYLARVLDLRIVGRYRDDRFAQGIDPGTPVTLDASDEPALTVIELLLDQCATDDPCTWQLRDGYVEVGTKDRLGAASARETRCYPLRDLLSEPLHFDNAPQLDIAAALSQAGSYGGGGTGGGGMGGGGGGLIFGQPDEPPDRAVEQELADQIILLITQSVEPEAWPDNGGEWASIHYFCGTLIIRAPDFVHRQIGGYR